MPPMPDRPTFEKSPSELVARFDAVIERVATPAQTEPHYGAATLKVSQLAIVPARNPVLNHLARWSADPCVHDSLVIVPVACSWMRSSPTASAAPIASLTSPSVIDSTFAWSGEVQTEFAQTPA